MLGKNNHIFLSALFGSLSGALIGALVVAGLAFWLVPRTETEQKQTNIDPQPAMKFIESYQCAPNETKRVIMRGKEDHFSPLGNEMPSIREPIAGFRYWQNGYPLRQYDELGIDKNFLDHVILPANISKGMIVTSAKFFTTAENDIFTIGNFEHINYDIIATKMYSAETTITPKIKYEPLSMWQNVQDNIYFIALETTKLTQNKDLPENIKTVLDYVRINRNSSVKETVLDVSLQDDTALDYLAFVVCQEQDVQKGVTFAETTALRKISDQISYLSCDEGMNSKLCNPIIGDTVCSAELPVACYNQSGIALPPEISSIDLLAQIWGGGETAFTPAVKATRFKTVHDVNAYCAAQFGKEWRILSYHDGGIGQITNMTSKRVPGQRAWVDIKDQPHATCWTR